MIDNCRDGLIDLILTKQMSRFRRKTINTLQTIYVKEQSSLLQL